MQDFALFKAIARGLCIGLTSAGIGAVAARETGSDFAAIAAFRIMATLGAWQGGNVVKAIWEKPKRPPPPKRNNPFEPDC